MPRDFLGVVEVNEMEIEILGIFGNEIGRLRRGKATDSKKAAFVYSKSTVELSSSILCHRHHNITEKQRKSLFVLFFKVRAGDPVFMYLEVSACF